MESMKGIVEYACAQNKNILEFYSTGKIDQPVVAGSPYQRKGSGYPQPDHSVHMIDDRQQTHD